MRKIFGSKKTKPDAEKETPSPPPDTAPKFAPRDLARNIGRYQIIREIGRGGGGVVYLAHDPFIDRQVAIKEAKLRAAEDLAQEEREKLFFNEVRATGGLEHPNIVSLFDITMEDERYYMIMEYVDGATLQPHISRGNLLPLERAVQIIFIVAEALHFTHERGIVHGDIKPSNILISNQGKIKISDFGSAQLASGNQSSSGLTTLSVLYAAPERLRSEGITPRSDIFSLGIVFYELLTGVKPFIADSELSAYYQMTNTPPPPLSNYRKDVPESLARAVMKTLAPIPDERYSSCQEFSSELAATFGHLTRVNREVNFQEKYNSVKKLNFFKEFTSSELIDVLQATDWAHYPAGTEIIREGEHEDSMYILLSGEVEVVKEGRRIARLSRGACFGEMAFLLKTTRTATVKALKNCALMRISPAFIEGTSSITQLRFANVFIKTVAQRLAKTSDILAKAMV